MRDILPPSSFAWNHVEEVARRIFHQFNYAEIRTPILEETALFARGVGEETDIVSKEMYTFEDRRQFANAATREHCVRHSVLYRTPPRSAARPAQALLHGSDVPAGTPAKGPISAVLSDRSRGHRVGLSGR